MKKKKIVKVSALILTLTIINGSVCFAETTGEQIQANKQATASLEAERAGVQAQLDSLSTQVSNIAKEIRENEQKISKKLDEIQKVEEELVQAKVDESNQFSVMKQHIKYMFEGGNKKLIAIILESKSMADCLNKCEYAANITRSDKKTLDKLKKVEKEISEKETKVKKEYEDLSSLKKVAEEKHESLNKLVATQKIQIDNINAKIGANNAALSELQSKQEQEIEAARAAIAAASYGSASYSSQGASRESGSGIFSHPCPGYSAVSSPFGYRTFDNSFHKGVDFAAAMGTPVYAAESGTVIIAGFSSSAGNWVVINHGNGLVTKYMHNSSLCVSAGQTVSRGENIAFVGNTGASFGAHCHFQVEENGVAVDPMGYL